LACETEGRIRVTDGLLRIGELAAHAGVSTRTVDFYTGLGLLVPTRRSDGNFRLYQPADAQRIAAIRHLEAQGIRLEDIAHVLAGPAQADHTGCAKAADAPCPADPSALGEYLTSLGAQVRALQDAAEGVDPRTGGVLAILAMRAQALIATAVILAADVLPHADHLPPM
jgi:MerR family copper efflux transcriptional regulator